VFVLGRTADDVRREGRRVQAQHRGAGGTELQRQFIAGAEEQGLAVAAAVAAGHPRGRGGGRGGGGAGRLELVADVAFLRIVGRGAAAGVLQFLNLQQGLLDQGLFHQRGQHRVMAHQRRTESAFEAEPEVIHLEHGGVQGFVAGSGGGAFGTR